MKTDSYEMPINSISHKLLKKEHAILIVILVLNLALRLYGVIVDVDYFFREATFGMAAWRIIDGDLPYIDFFHAQAPLSPFLLAFVFLLFGVGILQARLFLVVFTTFTCFMIFMAGKKINYKTGLLGCLIFAVVHSSVRNGMVAVNDFIAVTFCIIGYYFLTPIILGNSYKSDFLANRKYAFLAGVFVSIGVTIKIIVAPILPAFIVVLVIEGLFARVRINEQVKNIAFLLLGFAIPFLLVFSPFYLTVGEKITLQVWGQHLEKPFVLWGTRWILLTGSVIWANLYFFVFFSLSAFFAVKKPYGRGLLICTLFMLFSVFLFVPRQQANYYYLSIPLMSMICGFFPLSDFKSVNLRSALLSFIVFLAFIILNFTIFTRFYPARFYFPILSMPFYNYPSYYLTLLTFAAFFIALTVFIALLIKEGQFDGLKIENLAKNVRYSPYTILKDLKAVLNHDGVKIALVMFFVILITVTNVTYPRLLTKDKIAIDWVKANTSPDEYVLADNLKINFRAKRRSPFAEISRERTVIGELTGEMFIHACYDFDIRVVVNTEFLFGGDDTYDVFLEFLEENYVPIKEGHTIYIRTTPLQ